MIIMTKRKVSCAKYRQMGKDELLDALQKSKPKTRNRKCIEKEIQQRNLE